MARPKGSLNKVSITLKSRISLFIDRNFHQMQKSFEELDAMQKVNCIRDLLPFVTAKMASSTNEVEIKTKLEGLSDQQLESLIDEVLNNSADED